MAKKLWGGRFQKKTDPLVEEFTRSIQFDHALAAADITGSRAHVSVLKKAGYLTGAEAKKLDRALQQIAATILAGTFIWDKESEDIHTDIQNKLQKKVGNLVLKLHTARSRNDQVAIATRLYAKQMLRSTQVKIDALTNSIAEVVRRNERLVIPGFTHLQHAQPVYLKDYLRAYTAMLARDLERLECVDRRIALTMGSGALAGTPIEAKKYALNGIAPTANTLDSVSDRDFVIEIISCLSIVATHLSRLAEDLIIWSTQEFDFIEIDETFCTGSSLMPQKKNPDVLELIRGYAGRLYGNLVSVLTMMKGLPLTYNRDMQLDKEPLFNSFEIVSSELKVLTGLMKTLRFNEERIKECLEDESLYATDLVYYLVDKKIAFKDAHTVVGKLIKYSLDNRTRIKDMPETVIKKFSDKFVKKEIIRLFDPRVSVESKKSILRTT